MTSLFYTRYLKPPPRTVKLGKPFTIAWTVANDLGEISYWEPLTIYCRLITTNNTSLGLLLDKSNSNRKYSKNNGSNIVTLTSEAIRSATTSVKLEYDPIKGGGIMTNSLTIVSTTNNSGSTRNNTNTNGVTVQLVLELSDKIQGHPIWTNARSLMMDDDVCCWVLPVYSLPIQILSPSTLFTATQYGNNNNDNNIHAYERRVAIHRYGAASTKQQQDLFIHEDASPSIGSHIWDCGMLMCQYLAEQFGIPYFDRILELGSGTAIAGIYAAHMLQPSTIYLTDLEDTVPTIQHSVSLLKPDPLIKHVKIIVKELEWGKPLILSDQPKTKKSKGEQEFDGFVDMVLLTDVLYNPSFHDSLIDTLQQLMNINPKMKILLGYKPRDEGEERTFFDKIKTNLGWQWEMTLLPPAEIYWITSSSNAT